MRAGSDGGSKVRIEPVTEFFTLSNFSELSSRVKVLRIPNPVVTQKCQHFTYPDGINTETVRLKPIVDDEDHAWCLGYGGFCPGCGHVFVFLYPE